MSEMVPEFMSLSAAMEAKSASEAGNKAAERLRSAALEGRVEREPNGMRSFVCPTQPNTRFLVRAGDVESAPYQQAALGLRPALSRQGDIWLKFVSGVCSTDDPIQIEWLEAHTGDPEAHRAYHEAKGQNARTCGAPIGLCREQGPGVDDWYKLKLSQIDTASEKHGIPPEVDIDAIFRGEHVQQGSRKSSTPATDLISAVSEANEQAARERADGQRN